MTKRILLFPRARSVAMAVGVGVLGSLALATPSLAIAPAAGVACQATDGKVSGRGSTFQNNAVLLSLSAGYTADVCGAVALQYAGDPAGTGMIAYNYPAASTFVPPATGSGAGQKATSCRTDAFGGTDIPYDQATLALLRGAAGSIAGCDITFAPPYTPSPNAGAPFYPHSGDSTAPVMSFPITGGAAAIAVRLVACAQASLQFTSHTMTRLLGGEYATWGAPDLVADNPGLSGCTTPVTRIVRSDKSGTTQTVKNYLKNSDPARALCDGVNTWTDLALDANNIVWPTGGTCVGTLLTASGTGGVKSLTDTTDGGVGYGDLSAWKGDAAVVLANLQTQASTGGTPVYASPGSFTAGSNCNLGVKGLPGATANDAVGLNSTSTWASDAPTNVSDLTFNGSGYPICTMTYDFVYTKLNNGAVANPIAGLTADQRRTMYSFFTYVFSPAAQFRLLPQGYDQLPATFLTKLRQGFQANF